MPNFHNPYNFVPVGTRTNGAAPGGPLDHGQPVGHDCYQPDLWSGRIDIQITVKTPLIIPTPEPTRVDGDHKTYGLRKDKAGLPLLPVTSLKGPLRSAYEAITNSRMGVFPGHKVPPARRMAAREGLKTTPVRFVRMADGKVAVELWTGASSRVDSLQQAAWLPVWRHSGNFTNLAHGDEVACRLQRVEHTRWDNKRSKHDRDFDFWQVVSVRKSNSVGTLLDRTARAQPINLERSGGSIYKPVGDPIDAVGFVVAGNRNFGSRKHDERIFFVETSEDPRVVPIEESEFRVLAKRWRELIADSRKLHEDAIKARRKNGRQPSDWLGPRQPAFSRHTYCDGDIELVAGTPFDANREGPHEFGTLCYATMTPQDKIVDLLPVMISRELGHVSPKDMLPAHAKPTTEFSQLSPADRVFGWVAQDRDDKNETGAYRGQPRIHAYRGQPRIHAYRGQLRIHPIVCTNSVTQQLGDRGLPLAILGQPKVAQARFYLARDERGTPLRGFGTPPNQRDDITKDGYFNNSGTTSWSLRGRKVYPHHKATTATAEMQAHYWNHTEAQAETGAPNAQKLERGQGLPPLYREYVRHPELNKTSSNRDSQNRSITEWVAPGATFTTSIDVINLNEAELGALLWLLDMNRFEASTPENAAHLRLGYGKPLGFGSVTIAITGLDLRDGEAKRADYIARGGPDANAKQEPTGKTMVATAAELTANGVPTEATGAVDTFKAEIARLYGAPFANTPFIRAWLHASRGFADNWPIHYPRSTDAPRPDGENFKWFVKNNNTHHVLGDLAEGDSDGLPIQGA